MGLLGLILAGVGKFSQRPLTSHHASTHGTGHDPVDGLDCGGTRPTKPGNPDKSGPARPEEARRHQTIVSGDQNRRTSAKAR